MRLLLRLLGRRRPRRPPLDEELHDVYVRMTRELDELRRAA